MLSAFGAPAHAPPHYTRTVAVSVRHVGSETDHHGAWGDTGRRTTTSILGPRHLLLAPYNTQSTSRRPARILPHSIQVCTGRPACRLPFRFPSVLFYAHPSLLLQEKFKGSEWTLPCRGTPAREPIQYCTACGGKGEALEAAYVASCAARSSVFFFCTIFMRITPFGTLVMIRSWKVFS